MITKMLSRVRRAGWATACAWVLALGVLSGAISGCATSGTPVVAKPDRVMRALPPDLVEGSRTVMMEVPAPGDPLATMILVASIKLSSPPAADSILKLLRSGQAATLVVFSERDRVAAATIESAIKRFDGPTPEMLLVYVGELSYAEGLSELAAKAGVRFAAYPLEGAAP